MFLRALVGRERYMLSSCAALAAAAAASPQLRREAFRKRLLRGTLAGTSVVQAWGTVERTFPCLEWEPGIVAEYERHRDAGRRILVASGGLSFCLSILLQMKGLRFDDLLATEMKTEGGVFTGEMVDRSCTGDEKARRVRIWLEGTTGEVWCYGNLPHDEAMLALSDHPTVVVAKPKWNHIFNWNIVP